MPALNRGEAVRGELHSTDASGGVEITLYRSGSLETRTLQSDEFLSITSIHMIGGAAGDHHVFMGADNTPGAGETVIRGTLGASPQATEFAAIFAAERRYSRGHKPYLIAPSGTVDVVFDGYITNR